MTNLETFKMQTLPKNLKSGSLHNYLCQTPSSKTYKYIHGIPQMHYSFALNPLYFFKYKYDEFKTL